MEPWKIDELWAWEQFEMLASAEQEEASDHSEWAVTSNDGGASYLESSGAGGKSPLEISGTSAEEPMCGWKPVERALASGSSSRGSSMAESSKPMRPSAVFCACKEKMVGRQMFRARIFRVRDIPEHRQSHQLG